MRPFNNLVVIEATTSDFLLFFSRPLCSMSFKHFDQNFDIIINTDTYKQNFGHIFDKKIKNAIKHSHL